MSNAGDSDKKGASASIQFWPAEEVEVLLGKPPRWTPAAVVQPQGRGYLVRIRGGALRPFNVDRIRRPGPSLTLLPPGTNA